MKKFVYMILAVFSIIACSKSITKMVEKGEYDKAFNYAIKKLAGEKNKKTEYVKALENTYVKLNSTTLKEIDKLNASARPENWPKVLQLYTSIENRQDKLEPLLPLVSENGYKATFEIKSYRNAIMDAENNTCEWYYNNALTLIARSEKTGDKIAARDALAQLKNIDRYKQDYKDSQRLKDRAYSLGITKVSIQVFNNLRDFHSDNIERSLFDMPLSKLDKTWLDVVFDARQINADYLVEVELKDIFFTPERERMHTYTESKEVLISKDKSKNGNDSSWVEKQVFEKVKAEITEVFREKQAELHGNVRIVNARTNKTLKTVPVNVYHDFKGYSCGYIGDKRALTEETSKKLDTYLESFPSNFVMSDNLAEALKNAVFTEIKNYRFE